MNQVYNYNALTEDLTKFHTKHPNVPIFSIGQSTEGRNLSAIKLGTGLRRVLFHGAHHGMEWLTARLLMELAFDLSDGLNHAEYLLKKNTLYLVPMVNPDGVEIAATGKKWQANARGVDLNHNYDALWQKSKESEKNQGISGPGPTRFSGPFPESEPESHALANFTRQNVFDLTLSFHSQGEVIYWDFNGYAPTESLAFLDRFETVSPYRRDIPDGAASHGGYKDWFLKTFKKPGFTIEIGKGENPLPMKDFEEIYQRTLPLMLEALNFFP